MPSKEQKKLDKREQNELNRLAEHQKYMEELEWEKGTDKRGIERKQQQNDKQLEKLRRKQERQELLEEEG
jgi:hypothetical protein